MDGESIVYGEFAVEYVRADLHASEVEALRRERDTLAARVKALEAELACPLGLDPALWEICSAGTCPKCGEARMVAAEARVKALEEALRDCLAEIRAHHLGPDGIRDEFTARAYGAGCAALGEGGDKP